MRRLTELLEQLPGNTLAADGLLFELRKHIERQGSRQRYPLIILYADWLVHPQIDRNKRGAIVLLELTKVLINEKDSDPDNFLIAVQEVLSLEKLRHEIIDLLSEISLPHDSFINNLGWTAFLKYILNAMVGCPLIFSDEMITKDRKIKELYDEACVIADKAPNLVVVGFAITDVPEWISSSLSGKYFKMDQSKVHWTIKTRSVDSDNLIYVSGSLDF